MTQTSSLHVLILAAGKGTRMHSDTTKILHEVAGRALIDWVIDAAATLPEVREITPILGHDREAVLAHLSTRADAATLSFVTQEQQQGTGHAVWQASPKLRQSMPAHVLILSGDVPNLAPRTLRAFLQACAHQGAAAGEGAATLGVMTAVLDDPATYGRILRDDQGKLLGIVEWKDATAKQREIREINTGIYLAKTAFLLEALDALCGREPENAQGEYYLTDIVAYAAERGEAVVGWALEDEREVQGVNTRADLALAEHFAQTRARRKFLASGVTMLDPASVFLDAQVAIAPDVTLHPNVNLRGQTTLASGSVIEPNCVLRDAQIGPDCHIKAGSYIDHATVEAGAVIGPYAHLRPEASVGQGCKVGNFVEIKKTRLDDGAKVSHLSYLGDAHIGAGANIGAGTITCNYDGKRKHRTHIGQGAFVGTNSSLVAPLHIGDHAYVGAGSTITNTVPAGALGVARGRQRVIEGWVNRRLGAQGEEE